MALKYDLTGQRFGKLCVVGKRPVSRGSTYWNCICDCGTECVVRSVSLRNGTRSDCGCESRLGLGHSLIDLTGQRFGKLQVLRQAESAADHSARWVCVCDCGNECVVRSKSLRQGKITDCGCETVRFYDLAGQRFGKLTVMEKGAPNSQGALWRCRCDCGNDCEVLSRDLRAGRVTNCGCEENDRAGNGFVDLTGQRFGRLTVLQRTPQRPDGRVYWKCQCDCGNICQVSSHALRNVGQQTCGCGKIKDIQGQRFGKLTVLERSDHYVTIKGGTKKYQWKCRCDCGKIVYRLSEKLREGIECSCIDCMHNMRIPKMREAAGFVEGTQVSRIKSMKPTALNQSGVRGVFWNRKTQRWRAMLKFKGVSHYLGEYKELQDAVCARKRAEGIYFGEFLDSLESEHIPLEAAKEKA